MFGGILHNDGRFMKFEFQQFFLNLFLKEKKVWQLQNVFRKEYLITSSDVLIIQLKNESKNQFARAVVVAQLSPESAEVYGMKTSL